MNKFEVPQFPGFQILDVAGRGGYGTIYRARNIRSSRIVALKTVATDAPDLRRAVRRLKREIAILVRLNHENIIRGYGEVPGASIPTIELEYFASRTLTEWEREKKPTLWETVDTLFQAGLGLSYLHAHGFMHLDLKPGNVLVSDGGGVKLIDFSLARPFRGLKRYFHLPWKNPVSGTPAYMSPEQILNRRCDRRSDLYAFGVLLYRMVTGEAPFQGTDAQEIVSKHLSRMPELPTLKRSAIPQSLEGLILRLLQKDPAARLSSMDEVCARMGKIARGLDRTRRDRPAGADPRAAEPAATAVGTGPGGILAGGNAPE